MGRGDFSRPGSGRHDFTYSVIPDLIEPAPCLIRGNPEQNRSLLEFTRYLIRGRNDDLGWCPAGSLDIEFAIR